MLKQGMLAIVTAMVWIGAGEAARAQSLPPLAGPPLYREAQGSYQGPYQGAYERPLPVEAAPPPYEPGLPPYEIVAILRETGFLPLGAPARRGRFYVIAAIHPNGEDGRLTLDAQTGRLMRFVPAYSVLRGQRIYDAEAYAPPAPPPAIHGPRPPAAVPKVASRAPAAQPLATPKPRPQAAPAPVTAQAPPVAAPAPAPKPAETAAPPAKPAFTPLPSGDLPPVQTLE